MRHKFIFGYAVLVIINLLFVLSIVKALFFDPASDTNAMFSIIVFIIALIYNVYAMAANVMCGQIPASDKVIGVLYPVLLLLPVSFIVYFAYC